MVRDGCRVDRQARTEGAAAADPVVHPNASTMTLNNALGNEQTESHAPAISVCQRDEAVKDRFHHYVGSMLLNEQANFLVGSGHVRKQRRVAVVAVLLEPLPEHCEDRCAVMENDKTQATSWGRVFREHMQTLRLR
jgi:hypothetical protein